MADYFHKDICSFTVIRELHYLKAPTLSPLPPVQGHTYHCDSFEEAFDLFNKMYEMDKTMWCRLRRTGSAFSDYSKDEGIYTFTYKDRMLRVKIENIDKLAREVFGLTEEDE